MREEQDKEIKDAEQEVEQEVEQKEEPQEAVAEAKAGGKKPKKAMKKAKKVHAGKKGKSKKWGETTTKETMPNLRDECPGISAVLLTYFLDFPC